jgi:integrase
MARTGTGRIFQRGEQWWLDYSFRGKRYRESSESTKRSDATALLRKRMAEMGRGQHIGRSEERVSFEDLMRMIETDYAVNGRKSARRLKSTLAHLRGFFGLSRAIDVTTDRVNCYIAHRQEEGAAPATIRQELSHLKRALNLAVQAGRLSVRPHIPGIRVSNTREGFFEAAELERVIGELPEASRPVVRFAAFTGWRSGEVLPLQWSQVDFAAGVVRLAPGSTKNDEGREFPFGVLPPLRALLEAQRERTRQLERETGHIVPNVFHRNGKPIRTIRSGWEAACERAGLKGWLFHDLRRTAVRNLERAGVPRSVAMKLTGHKTEAVYRRYAIADSRALAEGVEKLARLHAAPIQPAKVHAIQGGAR